MHPFLATLLKVQHSFVLYMKKSDWWPSTAKWRVEYQCVGNATNGKESYMVKGITAYRHKQIEYWVTVSRLRTRFLYQKFWLLVFWTYLIIDNIG
jgi:hypothetical protein